MAWLSPRLKEVRGREEENLQEETEERGEGRQSALPLPPHTLTHSFTAEWSRMVFTKRDTGAGTDP